MPSDWYVVIDGKSCGPLDDSRIEALKREGQITPETLVCRAGMKQRLPARRVKGLFPDSQIAANQASPKCKSRFETTLASAPVVDFVAGSTLLALDAKSTTERLTPHTVGVNSRSHGGN